MAVLAAAVSLSVLGRSTAAAPARAAWPSRKCRSIATSSTRWSATSTVGSSHPPRPRRRGPRSPAGLSAPTVRDRPRHAYGRRDAATDRGGGRRRRHADRRARPLRLPRLAGSARRPAGRPAFGAARGAGHGGADGAGRGASRRPIPTMSAAGRWWRRSMCGSGGTTPPLSPSAISRGSSAAMSRPKAISARRSSAPRRAR